MRAQLRIAIAGLLTAFGISGAQSVPVTKVMLFSSGVGYFEHAGSVRGNASTELRFKTSQINDILKSIVLAGPGWRAQSARSPIRRTILSTRPSRAFRSTSRGTRASRDLLNQLRGARVTIAVQAEHLTGTILGVERRQKAPERGEEPVEVPVLNLLTGAIDSVDRAAVDRAASRSTIPQLQDELTKALTALVQARDQDKKPVTINFGGAGDRRVRIGYVVETPVWKTSYRLLLGDKQLGVSPGLGDGRESDGERLEQRVALTRERTPVSFIMDLYQPLYATRPVVRPELYAGLTPQTLRRRDATRGLGRLRHAGPVPPDRRRA